MRLYHLTLAALVIAGCVLTATFLFGIFNWQRIDRQLDAIATLERQHRHVSRLGTAVEYVTTIEAEPGIVGGLVEDAGQLGDDLAGFDHRLARVARRHLDEIAHMAEHLLELDVDGSLDLNTRRQGDPRLPVVREIRVHQAGARESIAQLIDARQQEIFRAIQESVWTLIVALLLFAALIAAASPVIYRRLVQPAHALNRQMHEFRRGRLDARVDLDGNDELSELARSFNRMASERRDYELRLRESEERFRQIAEHIGEVFWVSEPDRVTLRYLSPAVETIWGRPAEDFVADPRAWLESIHPDDRAIASDALDEPPGSESALEYRIIRPDGETRWIHDRAVAFHDRNDRISHFIGVARDITERRRFQQALWERIKELHCLYRVLELTTESDRTAREVATETAALLPEAFLHPDRAIARVIIGDGQAPTSEAWRTPAVVISSGITVDGNRVGRVDVGYRDVPEHPEGEPDPFLEEEVALVRGVAQHLGRMIKQRRLAESLAQTERLRAIGELTGGIAHDFNNLLTVIIGNAQLLQESLVDEGSPMASTAGMIASAGEQGADLTGRLLAFARRQALEPTGVDINELLEGMGNLLERTLGEAMELKLNLGAGLPAALVDRAQIESAVLNLCLNARDAMRRGGQLTLETETVHLHDEHTPEFEDVEPGAYVLVSVTDTGDGIEPERIERVFDPFYTTKEAGTGLGLSMVYGLIRQLHGKVKIRSEPGCGTVVELYLPVADGEGDAGREPRFEPVATTGGETVLLVEDNELVRHYAADQLREAGYHVLVADHATAAVDMLEREEPIDLLLTDVVMPGDMDGPELAERALQMRPGLRLLYTSGYTESAIARHGRAHPAPLLAKPFHRNTLLRHVRLALDTEDPPSRPGERRRDRA